MYVYFQSLRDNAGINDMSRDLTPNLESVDDTQSIDLDVQSEVSEVGYALCLVKLFIYCL